MLKGMALQKCIPRGNPQSVRVKPTSFSAVMLGKAHPADADMSAVLEDAVDIDLREIYFLIMHFLSSGPCHRTYGQLWNELLEHNLLPRRFHAWYSRTGKPSGDENDDGLSFPLSYSKLVERYPHIEKDHLVKLLKQLILRKSHSLQGTVGGIAPSAADVPTLLGTGPFSLLSNGKNNNHNIVKPPISMRWPHMQADQVCALRLREIGGGFTRHHRAPSSRAACYAIAKPTTMVQKMQNIKKTRGHRNAVYCAMLDCSGRFVITGSDDRLVKIWSMETAYCLASCRGHEGDITDLAVSSNNALVASSSNDCIIRVWRLPDGLPISVLRGHTGAVTAIAFSPRPSAVYQLLSSSDDGTCRLWDARYSQFKPRIYVPRPSDSAAGKSGAPSSSSGQQNHQIFCCAFNASGTVFVTGSSDTLARVWNACKTCTDNSEQPNHEMDVLSGHENDVNYVQFSGCTVASRFSSADAIKEDSIPKFRNSWFAHDNIVTCSRDGSAIIWIPKSRKSHGKAGRWTRAYHLKVPPPPMPPQPPRGGPRHRVLPTPRGVNMIVWSLDNRFVLAAIMDCRICVWNAADGSLVHSLTGHTESTYVLDVHPFNPRIAMSAGYDGKTILWDIWEGRPIKVYEIARFKLVDGKFSPDGTSIILSDDVGQLYILSTGQGESQKDAQYDQFFLGDYRPLIQDTYGNVVDQETQLAPYRRNMQDLLCDSTMIPYPEPYQSMYQRRRLGALGIEWRPSSVRFAVGPDFNSNQDFQIMPLADLDIVIDPLPEFVDAMDWEPEVEVQTDDSDTEFNITEEFSIGAEDGSLSSTTSGGLESDAEDSEGESGHKDGLRRSRRKNKKRDVEMTTSSGRRVKRSRVDEYGDNAHRLSQARNYRTGRKVSKKKKVSSKSLRPQRAAARNALSLFSKIKGLTPGREDQDGSEADFSECESTEDSTFESEDSDKSPQVEQEKFSKGKEVILDDSEDAIKADYLHESHGNSGNKRNMLLRLQIREPNRSLDSDGLRIKPEEAGFVGSSSKASCDKHVKNLKPQDNGLLTGVYCDGIGKWGGVRARSSKRLRSAETMPAKVFSRSNASANGQLEIENGSVRHVNPAAECGLLCVEHVRTGNSEGSDDTNIKEHDRCNGFNDFNEPTDQTNVTSGDQDQRSIDNDRTCDFNQPMRLRIKSKRTSSPSSPSMLNFTSDARYGDADACPPYCEIQPCFLQQSSAEDMENVHGCNMEGMNSGYLNRVENSNGLSNGSSSPALPDSQDLPSRKIDRMYSAVYRRSKSSRSRVNSEGDGHCKGESTSNISNQNLNSCTPIDDGATNGAWAHSIRPGSTSLEISEEVEGLSLNRNDERSCDAWGSRMTLGLRSARNRRNSYVRDTSPVDRRKSNQSQKKLSWLMLSTPEGSRYIPQHGDDVVYLRQGHQEYMYGSRFSDQGPWECLKGQIRAVEFCKVKGLEYSTLPGSGDSCCKMTLEFVDSCSDVCGKRFKLTLPEVITFPDFIVERTRYEAAVQRNWSARDKCQVWWKNEGEEDGSWWEGRILGSKAKSAEFPDSPWERFIIRYKSDPGETHLHSPWELYDADTQWEQPRIDDGTREKLLTSLVKLEQSGNRSQDNYGVKKLKQVAQKTSFLNRFPVPLSLDVIQSRLENNYYRSLEAMKHDVEVMLRNVEVYFGKNAELSAKMKRLSDWFARKLSSLKQ